VQECLTTPTGCGNARARRPRPHSAPRSCEQYPPAQHLLCRPIPSADPFRDGETVLHSFGTWTQLASIEGSTLRAPEGEADDRADSYASAIVAQDRARRQAEQGSGRVSLRPLARRIELCDRHPAVRFRPL
jgi:hypothetical protein